ncbi:CshA/CshB family fibrillar adhesin-related protein [Clostridioides difficile]
MANLVKYANTNSPGALPALIGWLDYGEEFILSNVNNSANIVNNIPGGYKISFTVSYFINPNEPTVTIKSFKPPVFNMNNIPFGGTAYKGIDGYVVIYMPEATPEEYGNTTITLTISNIAVTKNNNLVNDYIMVVADAETTNYSNRVQENWQATTNGGDWRLLDIMPSSNSGGMPPTIDGLGTKVVLETGINESMSLVESPVYLTMAPSTLKFEFTTNHSREGVALGIIINQSPIIGPQCLARKLKKVCRCGKQYYIFESEYNCCE